MLNPNFKRIFLDLIFKTARLSLYIYLFTIDKRISIGLLVLDFIINFIIIYYKLSKIKHREYLLQYLKHYYERA